MIREILPYLNFLQCISEKFDEKEIDILIDSVFGAGWGYITYKTSKDEVLQVYNDTECYNFIGGSSGDRYEWNSNFEAFPLIDGLIHGGFYDGAVEVMNHKDKVDRDTEYYNGYSRGSAVASVCCYLTGCAGVGFGTPKAFKREIDTKVRFYNIRNHRDFVCHVVPTFKTFGIVKKYKFGLPLPLFWLNPKAHIEYGKHIKETDTLW